MPATITSESHGNQSPHRTYGVTTSDERIVCRRIAVRNSPTSDTTRPLVSMNALMPETAAFTTHRPFSTARIRLICRCCADAAVVPYDALFTGTTRNPAPSRTKSRTRDGKLFSKQIGVPNAGSPSTDTVCTRSPGVRSIGTCLIAETHDSSSRHGTYSPNGTRCTLS